MVKSPFKVYPWPNLEAFDHVATVIERTQLTCTESADQTQLAELSWCRDQLIVWRSRYHNQHYHELHATCSLLMSMCTEIRLRLARHLHSQPNRDSDGNVNPLAEPLSLLISSSGLQELTSLYSISLLECFKMLAYYEVSSPFFF
jgi:hypothetical protein